jgi:hypothetical protein
MWEYNDKEYIKLFRKITSWEWYTDVNTFKLFLHCLIKANWKPGRWKGIPYERGQFFTSLASLSRETGLTIRQTRTALAHLKMTGEVTESLYPKKRLITVVCFDKYQGERQDNRQDNDTIIDKQIDKQATGNRQANDNRYKNIKNNKKVKKEKNIPDPPGGDPDPDPWAWGGPAPKRWDEYDEASWRKDQSNPNNPRTTRMEIWKLWGESDE